MTTLPLDPARVSSFAERMLDRLNGAAILLMTAIGHRTGLFDTMASMAPATSAEIAARAGLQERYVREWLGAMVTGAVIDYEPSTRRYRLPAEHAACLTRAATPRNLAVTAQWVAVLGSAENRVVDAFVRGGGVTQDSFARFHAVMAEESAQRVVTALDRQILPLVDGLVASLERGIDVLDVGCGTGGVLVHLARRFPKSRFTGIDIADDMIAAARIEARRHGATNVRFDVRDSTTLADEPRHDLITAFESIHEQAAPDATLRAIRRALSEDGVFLMQEPSASSRVEENLAHPFGPFLYTISCMYCMSVSLERGGPGLGACWGHQTAERMLREAGFSDWSRHELQHDLVCEYWVVRP